MVFSLVLATGVPILTQCGQKDESVICTCEYVTIGLKLEYPDGQPVLLDSCKVFWKSKNRFLEQDMSWNGYYSIVDDSMQNELKNRQEVMHFTGYLNGEIVHEQDVPVSADACHVKYLGTEPLTQTIF